MAILTINNEPFNVVDCGSGPALLFVHGFPLDHSMWNEQIDEFAASYRVIAPDLRGFGGSVVTPGKVTMEQHADDLAAILNALEIEKPVVFCGLSMGGYVAWQFWRRHRDRVAGLILSDTRATADTAEATDRRYATAQQVLREGPACLAEEMLPKLLAENTRTSRPNVVEAVRNMILNTSPEGIAAAQHGMADRVDITASLPTIPARSLLMVGIHDVLTPSSEMKSIAAAMPNSDFVEIPGAGHMVPMENPHAVNAVIGEFLDELEQQRGAWMNGFANGSTESRRVTAS
jgi:pimeloyl-ACP methyl ester carboxylesterase